MKACEREIVRTMVVEFFFEQLCKSHDLGCNFCSHILRDYVAMSRIMDVE